MAVAPTYAGLLAAGNILHVPGDLKEFVATGTVGASDTYVTGGFSITPAQFGLTKFFAITDIVFSTGHPAWWDSTNAKIKVFSAPATELANASTALQSATFLITGYGK